eukprot:2975840-Amphidinium_carterae.1
MVAPLPCVLKSIVSMRLLEDHPIDGMQKRVEKVEETPCHATTIRLFGELVKVVPSKLFTRWAVDALRSEDNVLQLGGRLDSIEADVARIADFFRRKAGKAP